MLWEPYPSYHNVLFSPLLVLEISLPERQINIGLTPFQVSGSTSTGRVICGTDLTECVSVPGDFLRPQGAFPQAFTPFRGGLGSLPGTWGAPNKGNADGAEGIFGKLRARVGYGPAPGPTIKKALCHTCPLGGAVNKYHRSISVLS